jgi:hypothetical protein
MPSKIEHRHTQEKMSGVGLFAEMEEEKVFRPWRQTYYKNVGEIGKRLVEQTG